MQIRKLTLILATLTPALALSACTADNADPQSLAADTLTECTEPRPQFCSREYRPVCATRDTGVRCVTTPCDSTEQKTFPNACLACSDPAVLGYLPGPCEDDAQ